MVTKSSFASTNFNSPWNGATEGTGGRFFGGPRIKNVSKVLGTVPRTGVEIILAVDEHVA
jgi:hypothetical protein